MKLNTNNKFLTHRMLFILCAFLIAGCSIFTQYGRAVSRGDRAFALGDYDSAVFEAAKALSVKRDYEKAVLLMDKAFPEAIKAHINAIDYLKSTDDEFLWDRVVKNYEQLISLVRTVQGLNMNQVEVWMFKANARDYTGDLTNAKSMAAEGHYLAGIRYQKSSSRDVLKQAASEYKIAMSFVSDYKDSQERYLQSRESAVLRIAIFPFENKSGKKKYGAVGETVSNEVISRLIADKSFREFVDIVNRDKISLLLEEQKLSQSGLINDKTTIEIGQIHGIHQLVVGEITNLSVSGVQYVKNKERMEREITQKEKYTGDDGREHVRDVKKKYTAQVTFHTKQIDASVIASFRVIDARDAAVLHTENLSGNSSYKHQWVTFTGQKEALSYHATRLSRQKDEIPPTQEKMVLRVLGDLSDKLVGKIKVAVQ